MTLSVIQYNNKNNNQVDYPFSNQNSKTASTFHKYKSIWFRNILATTLRMYLSSTVSHEKIFLSYVAKTLTISIMYAVS